MVEQGEFGPDRLLGVPIALFSTIIFQILKEILNGNVKNLSQKIKPPRSYTILSLLVLLHLAERQAKVTREAPLAYPERFPALSDAQANMSIDLTGRQRHAACTPNSAMQRHSLTREAIVKESCPIVLYNCPVQSDSFGSNVRDY